MVGYMLLIQYLGRGRKVKNSQSSLVKKPVHSQPGQTLTSATSFPKVRLPDQILLPKKIKQQNIVNCWACLLVMLLVQTNSIISLVRLEFKEQTLPLGQPLVPLFPQTKPHTLSPTWVFSIWWIVGNSPYRNSDQVENLFKNWSVNTNRLVQLRLT